MRVGVLGAGSIGRAVGRLLHEAGHDIMVSWASSDARLREAAGAIGIGTQTGTPGEAVAFANVVLFSPRFEHVEAVSEAAGSFAGRVVIDTTNPYTPQRDGLVDLGERTAAEVVTR
jgi:predicted dinucleotide-binding enzyme